MKRVIYMLVLSAGILLFACNAELNTDKLTGQWKVTEMKVDIPNVPNQLIENANILALSTTYEFKSDMKYCMTISKNELEGGRKHMGELTFNSNNFSLSTDSVSLEKNGAWAVTEKNDFNKPFFAVIEMKIEKITDSRLFLSETQGKGTIYYTLDKVD